MQAQLFETAVEEAIKFGPAARLLLTFPGSEDAVHIHPLAYNKVGDGGYRIEIRVSRFDDVEVVDDVIFLDASAVETIELQVKQKGSVWRDEPFPEAGEQLGGDDR